MKTIDAVDVAKLVRVELKTAFPGVKFTVKTKRTSSIRVGWVDGPTYAAVQAVVGKYEGAEFDPTQDLKTYNDTPYGNDFIFFDREFSDAKMLEAYNWFKENYRDWAEVTFIPSHKSSFGEWMVAGHFEGPWQLTKILTARLEEKI